MNFDSFVDCRGMPQQNKDIMKNIKDIYKNIKDIFGNIKEINKNIKDIFSIMIGFFLTMVI